MSPTGGRRQPARAGSGSETRARGAYFTPAPVAQWLAEHTLARAGRAMPHVLDPACGDGALLAAALDRLAARAANERGGALPARDRVELLAYLHGVDVDAGAVDAARRALAEVALAGCDDRELRARAEALAETRVLRGNALIETDYDGDDAARVLPLDFARAFPHLGGAAFGVVLANPPYGAATSPGERAYFTRRYRRQGPNPDTYLLFLERFAELLRPGGVLGVVLSNTWASSITLGAIRRHVTESYRFHRILALPRRAFAAEVDAHALVLERRADARGADATGELVVEALEDGRVATRHALPWSALATGGEPLNLYDAPEAQALALRVRQSSPRLADHCDVYNGLKPFERGKGTPPQTDDVVRAQPFVRRGARPDASWSPLLRGSLVHRYRVAWRDEWIHYGPWLAAPRDPAIFAPRKIVVRQTGDRLVAAIDEDGRYARNNLHLVVAKRPDVDLRVVLAVVNSALLDVVYGIMNPERGEALAEVKKAHVEALPLRWPHRSLHDEMVSLVEARMAASNERDAAKHERAIDALVCALFEVSEDEVARAARTMRPRRGARAI